MLNLSELEGFIQFIGAFNFANIYSRIEVVFRNHYLDVEKEFVYKFRSIRAKCNSLKSTIDSIKPITDPIQGISNERKLKDLKEKIDSVILKEDITRRSVRYVVKNVYDTKYSRPLFLVCGLYSTFIIFYYGLLKVMCQDPYLPTTGAIYNALILLYILYFIVSELVKHLSMPKWIKEKKKKNPCKWLFKKFSNPRGFKPTMWSALVGSIILLLLSIVPYFICRYIHDIYSYIPTNIIEILHWMSILIPALGFIITAIFSIIYYQISKSYTTKQFNELYNQWEKVIDEKEELDKSYESFTPIFP